MRDKQNFFSNIKTFMRYNQNDVNFNLRIVFVLSIIAKFPNNKKKIATNL